MKFFSCFQRYERIILLRRKWLRKRLRLFTAIHNNRPIAYGRPHVKFWGGPHLPLPRHCMEDNIPIPVHVNDFWSIFNLVQGMAYSMLDRCLVWYKWMSLIFVKSSTNGLGTNLKLILYINFLISSLKIWSILSIWVSLYNLHTLELNLLNVIILNNLLWIIFKVRYWL